MAEVPVNLIHGLPLDHLAAIRVLKEEHDKSVEACKETKRMLHIGCRRVYGEMKPAIERHLLV